MSLVSSSVDSTPSVHTHDIRLSSDSHQSVDVLTDGHQHLSSHMATLLCPRCLILNMYTSRALLDEELGELHDSRQASMTGICVGDNRPKIVDVGTICAVGLRSREAVLALLSVVEELGHEEVLYLVGYGGLQDLAYAALI